VLPDEVDSIVAELPLAARESLRREGGDSGDCSWEAPLRCAPMLIYELASALDCRDHDVVEAEPHPVAPAPPRRRVSNRLPAVLDPPPPETLAALLRPAQSSVMWAAEQSLVDRIPTHLMAVLKKHQLEGVMFALRRRGRALFGDEMGVGKTLQCLAVVAALRAFPLLIVCPAVVRSVWAEQVELWLHQLLPLGMDDVHVVCGHDGKLSQRVSERPLVVITSYRMAVELSEDLLAAEWKCVALDESHVLHTSAVPSGSGEAMHTSLCCELGRRAPHCLMLSGTPALNNPFDLFNQVDTLRQGLLGANRFVFASNYCHITLAPYFTIDGCTRAEELHALLLETVMIRRTKDAVLCDLPPKVRRVVRLEDSADDPPAVGPSAEDVNWGDKSMMRPMPSSSAFQGQYAASWSSRKKAIADFVTERLTDRRKRSLSREATPGAAKLVLFAHHIALLDFLVGVVQQSGRRCLRLDGSVPAQVRSVILADFRDSAEDVVAVVGVTACAVGVSLAVASHCIFCELPPDCASLLQAEDRLHRPGQSAAEVNVEILVGRFSFFDSKHLAAIQAALRSTSAVTDGASRDLFRASSSGRCTACGSADLAVAPVVPDAAATVGLRISHLTGLLHMSVLDAETGGDARPAGAAAGRVTFHVMALEDAERLRGGLHDAHEGGGRLPWEHRAHVDAFLMFTEKMSAFERRRLICSKQWFVSGNLRGELQGGVARGPSVPHLSTARFDTTWRSREGLCYAQWCVASGTSNKMSTNETAATADHARAVSGPAPLQPTRPAADGTPRFRVCCVSCLVPLQRQSFAVAGGGAVLPGSVLLTDRNIDMFCSGTCRMNYRIRRSQQTVRMSVNRLDRGVCTRCGVDCNALVSNAALLPADQRAAFAVAQHPQLALHPALLERLVRHPVAGNCWHVDHVVPVWQGGGSAGTENLQTLCVVCHATKTRMEAAARSSRSSCSWLSLQAGSGAAPGMSTLDQAERKVLLVGNYERRVTHHSK
jgi:hypothetical protein